MQQNYTPLHLDTLLHQIREDHEDKQQQSNNTTTGGERLIHADTNSFSNAELSEFATEPEEDTPIEDKEVQPYVEKQPQQPKVGSSLQRAGLKHVDPMKFKSINNVKLPISDDKVLNGLHAPVTSSFRWLAELAKLMLEKAGINLKKVHGHVIRVLKKK